MVCHAMPTPSYLSTFLWMQQLRGLEAFHARFAGAWLVWEPGPWLAPSRSTLATVGFEAGANKPKQGDALCFFLGPAKDGRVVQLGREPDNDVMISDGTVSRHHLVFTCVGGKWTVRVAQDRVATLEGQPIPAHDVPLTPGQVLRAGGVTLSFHETSTLLPHLVAAPPPPTR